MVGKEADPQLSPPPASKELLQSKIPARLAYVWTDGTPRVIPIWFHWNEREFVLATPPKAPKLKALVKNPKVALTIDDNIFPHKVLLARYSAARNPERCCSRICPRCRSLFRRRARAGLGRPDGHHDSRDGANHDYAGMGRPARLPGPFPERPAAVSFRPEASPRRFLNGIFNEPSSRSLPLIGRGRPNSVAPPASGRHGFGGGATGLGNGGIVTFGLVRLRAVARLPTSLDASRAVSGAKPHLHSISFRAEV